jgi:hypothetical protein
MRFLLAIALAMLLAGLTAACGGSSEDGAAAEPAAVDVVTLEQTTTAVAPAGSFRALLREIPGEDVALVLGSSDFSVGENRVTFLVAGSDGRLVDASSANVSVALGGLESIPTLETTAENLPVGVAAREEDDEFDVSSLWVTHLDLAEPGIYTLLVEPEGSSLQAVGQIEVKEQSSTPEIGAKAPPSDNPTLDDDFADKITTASPPDTELLRYSVEQSIEDAVPFVVTFATPKFCESRVCGPVVDIVDEARERLEGSGVRFIHVEVYENNDPDQGYNRWFQEWNLPSEPWTFLVDENGIVVDKFEALLTVDELEQAVRAQLL